MKKQLIVTLVLLVSLTTLAQSTPEKKESKLEFITVAKLGFAKLNQSDFVALNGNINAADLLLSYRIGKKWNLSSGVGLMELNANPTISGNSASLKNTYLHIPIKATGDYTIFNNESSDSKIFFTIGAGVYANSLLKSELQTLGGNSSTKNLGWNFGVATQIGAKFLISEATTIGIGLESQSDLSKMKKDGVERKVEQLNSIYFSFGFKF